MSDKKTTSKTTIKLVKLPDPTKVEKKSRDDFPPLRATKKTTNR